MTQRGEEVRSRTFVEAFARGLGVIEAFGTESPRMSVTDVAVKAGVDRAVARRLLLTLVELGYMTFDGKQFELTSRILRLGFSFISSLDLGGTLQPYLDDLSRKVEETISVTVLEGVDVINIARSDAAGRRMTFAASTGTRLPLIASASGRMLLTALTDDEVLSRFRTAEVRRFTSRTVVDLRELARIVAGCRKDGHAIVDGELEEGLIAGSVLLHTRSGRPVAALNVSSHISRTDHDRMFRLMIPEMKRAAADMCAMFP